MTHTRIFGPRSYLFVPATQPERIAKACASTADAVIVDLEDAVAAEQKDAAREQLLCALPELSRPVWLRINAVDTEWHQHDLKLISAAGLAGLVLPKSESAAQLEAISAMASELPVMALIESALGMSRVEDIAQSPAVVRLLFGSIDFGVDLGIPGEGDALLLFRSRLVLASRLAGLPAPVDGVTAAIQDVALLAKDTEQARLLGFGGKLCIHPQQLDVVNRAFVPDEELIDWAQRVALAGDAASQVDGAMVDKAVVERARAILAAARQFGVLR